ncbi:hypothetical protein J6590_062763 [Homalodisca vitripennis]|nr:hypothetical protein J6590_062763 [Homalodisca vitripennis]
MLDTPLFNQTDNCNKNTITRQLINTRYVNRSPGTPLLNKTDHCNKNRIIQQSGEKVLNSWNAPIRSQWQVANHQTIAKVNVNVGKRFYGPLVGEKTFTEENESARCGDVCGQFNAAYCQASFLGSCESITILERV